LGKSSVVFILACENATQSRAFTLHVNSYFFSLFFQIQKKVATQHYC